MPDQTRRTVSRGCGKLILFGEHAVVYGIPAIAAGLPIGATAWARAGDKTSLKLLDGRSGKTYAEVRPRADGDELERAFLALLRCLDVKTSLEVNVTIDVPIGAGMGSSAAMATAAARAIARESGIDESDPVVTTAVEASEQVFHGNPSGIDSTAALRGGIFKFAKGSIAPTITELEHERSIYLAVCQAGEPASTATMVTKVGKLFDRNPRIKESLNRLVGDVVFAAGRAIEESDAARLGELADINHGALVSMGVSTVELDIACHVARRAGATGAKLTGSGGGGCCFAFATRDTISDVIDAWDRQGLNPFQIVL